MLTDDLFRQVLIVPATDYQPDTLHIVSGYATANMTDRHIEQLAKLSVPVSINLVVGMTTSGGIERAQHMAFKKRMQSNGKDGFRFSCHYLARGNPVHAKVYIWKKNGSPILAFTGSANYTLAGFGRSQIEVLTKADENVANCFYNAIIRDSIPCTDDDIENKIILTETRRQDDGDDKNTISLPLLDSRTGETHKRAGLNWGKRKGRDPNQAYVPVPASVYKTDFFPPIGEPFTVLTDDGESFILVRAQENGKALQTTQDNSLLGKYIRSRLRVGSGQFITRKHLSEYGRNTVDFTKIDNDTYILDFRPNFDPGEDGEMAET